MADTKARSAVDVDVRYAETDQMGIVHHANYLVWFELARTHYCTVAGSPYQEIEKLGYFLIVTKAQQEYRLAARYGDRLEITCWLDWVASRSLQFGYEVRRGNELLSKGFTQHLWVERGTMRPCSMPDSLRKTFIGLAGQDAFTRIADLDNA